MTMLGEGRPKLVLVHGWGLGSAAWQPLLGTLSRRWHVIADDLPGYGHVPDDGRDFAASAAALRDALPAGASLGGWSLGALLAMQAAIQAPERIARLILFGATPCFAQRSDWPHGQTTALLDSFAANLAEERPQTLRRFVTLLNQGDRRARSISRSLSNPLSQTAPPSATVLARGLHWLRQVDLRPSLAMIRTPTLLIHGQNDALTTLAAGRYLADGISGARLEVFAEVGHAPFLSEPDRCAQLLSDFLDVTPTH